MQKYPLFILGLCIITTACDQTVSVERELPAGQVQHVVHASEMPWRPCPPNLPSPCEIAVLEGNPQSDGVFTVRFRLGDGFSMPAHTHPKEERVTILSGRVTVAFGRDATTFGPGDYYVNARDAVHTVTADDVSELQITGIGPWVVDFVD